MQIIAEIKLKSPSTGVLGFRKDLVSRAKSYQAAGADVISIITEEKRFNGHPQFIPLVKKSVSLPILQKDFITTTKQIYQAKTLGSDYLLLIANLVPQKTLQNFVDLCIELGIKPIVEIFDQHDLNHAISTNTHIIAVNARNLNTLEVNVNRACQLIKEIPQQFTKFGFSGIHGPAEVAKYINSGAQGVLVGTSLMQTSDIHSFITNLRNI